MEPLSALEDSVYWKTVSGDTVIGATSASMEISVSGVETASVMGNTVLEEPSTFSEVSDELSLDRSS